MDVQLINEMELAIDVGKGESEEYSEHARTDYKNITQEQKRNRNFLKKLFEDAGFINYPYEWWHWSYGDKYWGFVTGNKAIYGAVIKL